MIDKESDENILIYEILNKNLFIKTVFIKFYANPLRSGLMKWKDLLWIYWVYDGTRYLILFGPEKHDAI